MPQPPVNLYTDPYDYYCHAYSLSRRHHFINLCMKLHLGVRSQRVREAVLQSYWTALEERFHIGLDDRDLGDELEEAVVLSSIYTGVATSSISTSLANMLWETPGLDIPRMIEVYCDAGLTSTARRAHELLGAWEDQHSSSSADEHEYPPTDANSEQTNPFSDVAQVGTMLS